MALYEIIAKNKYTAIYWGFKHRKTNFYLDTNKITVYSFLANLLSTQAIFTYFNLR